MQISRGSIYYRRKPPNSEQVALTHSLDALHVAHPFAGSRMLCGLLQRQGHCVGRRHVRTLMKRMCINALYCKPHTSARHPQHKIYPYLLRVSVQSSHLDRPHEGHLDRSCAPT